VVECREKHFRRITRILFALVLCGCVTSDPNAGAHRQGDKAARGEAEKRRMIEERRPIWISEDAAGSETVIGSEPPASGADSRGTVDGNDVPPQPDSAQAPPLELYSLAPRPDGEARLEIAERLDEPDPAIPEGGSGSAGDPHEESNEPTPAAAPPPSPATAAVAQAASGQGASAASSQRTASVSAGSRPTASTSAPSAPTTIPSAAPHPAVDGPTNEGQNLNGQSLSARSREVPVDNASREAGLLEYTIPWSADGFSLVLNGLGWIYLGSVPGDPDEVVYQSRSYSATDTIFLFRTAKPGEYRLLFQFQDLKTGVPHNIEVSLSLVDAIAGASNPYVRGTIPGDYRKAVSLLAEKRFQEALYEYIAAFREGDEAAASAIGSLAVGAGEYATGASYWKRVMKSQNPQTRARGTIGYTDAVIRGALSDPIPVPDLVNGGSAIPADLLNSAAGFLGSRGELDKAITLYEHLIALYPENVTDKLLFTLARLYETESPRRDERKALAYYKKILEAYPLSEYWGEAQERIRYIERHYIHIR